MNQRYSSTGNATKIKVNDIEINYLKVGNGPQTLLMFPGAFGCINDMKPLTENLDREKYTIVVWEAPGFGLSRPPDRDFSPGHLYRDADYAIALMELLNVNKYSLLGWCNGGCTALIVASKAADRVEKLVVWNCNAFVTEKDVHLAEITQDIGKWPLPRREPMVEMYGEKYLSETVIAWVVSCRKLLEENDGDICRQALPKITALTLILHGARDGLVPVEHSVYLHENIKHSSLEIYPDGTHNMHFLLTQQFISAVDQFLTVSQ